jgi:hypothetical protein
MRYPATFSALLSAVITTAVPLIAAGPATAIPEAPDLSVYQLISADPYVDGGEVYFQTPDGLLCAIRPAQGMAGCDGSLPGAPPGANEVVLSPDQSRRGLRATANPLFVKPSGSAAAALPAGRRIAFADFTCAVSGPVSPEGPENTGKTMCAKDNPATQWFEIAPSGTHVGPPTPGLPAGFPDPNDFVVGDESYVVGFGAKDLFPVFAVGGGLTCKVAMFSGGMVGCDIAAPATLPGTDGHNEVVAQLPGPVHTQVAGTPRFATPEFPGIVKQLPTGHRIDSYGATCMATEDGVACFGAVGGPPQGFQVTDSETTTFGGT